MKRFKEMTDLKKTNKTKSGLELLSVFILIYFSNDTLLFGTNKNDIFLYIHIMVLAVVAGYWFLKKPTFETKGLYLLLILAFLNIVTMLISGDGLLKYVYQIFIMFLALIIVNNIRLQDFAKHYNNVIFVLGIASIIIFFINMFFVSLVTVFPKVSNENDVVYYYMGLGFANIPEYASIPRMYGIFREPGVFMIFLVLALLFEILADKEPSIKRSAVYVVAMLLTFSTAAYILIAASVVLMFTKLSADKINSRKTRIFKVFLASVLAIAVVIFFVGTEEIFKMVFRKLYIDNSSAASRMGSIETNLRIFYPKPIFGNGWSFLENNFERLANFYGYIDGGHNTNTLLKILAIYGIPYFSIVAIGMFNFWKRINRSLILGIIVFVLWIVALSNEDLSVNILTYILVFYGFSNLRFRMN